jgi:hypothetical protein
MHSSRPGAKAAREWTRQTVHGRKAGHHPSTAGPGRLRTSHSGLEALPAMPERRIVGLEDRARRGLQLKE